MNKFELFTIIYFWLDKFYENTTDDKIIGHLSEMNPFLWKEPVSADPAVYDEYCRFIQDKKITIENSLSLAKEYAATIQYADITEAFEDADDREWKEGLEKYLAMEHKGAEIS